MDVAGMDSVVPVVIGARFDHLENNESSWHFSTNKHKSSLFIKFGDFSKKLTLRLLLKFEVDRISLKGSTKALKKFRFCSFRLFSEKFQKI